MMTELPSRDRFIPYRGFKIWVREIGIDGDPKLLPLLCLHGGPGIPHDYLEALEAVAASGRRVIFYDQLGCGNSDKPHDRSLWTVDLFVKEVDAVRSSLGLHRIHLLGQSWGGMLAMQYAIGRPAGLESLIIASSPASIQDWIDAANLLRRELPADVQKTLTEHEQLGTTGSAEYQSAMMVFYRRHFCRLDPWPACVTRAFEKLIANPEVYYAMWGPSEFYVTGVLKSWDVTPLLGRIRAPTLITSGRYDEATASVMKPAHQGIAGSKHIVFEQSSHMSHVEEAERYIPEVIKFLDGVESKRRS